MYTRELKRHLFGLMTMVVGGTTALGTVFAMNAFSQAPTQEDKAKTADFQVEKKKPPPKQQPQPKRERRQAKASSAPRAPAPHLTNTIGGVDFALPGFASADFSKLGERLLGDPSKHTAMTAEVVDTSPKPRSQRQPDYPDKARQKGITGFVTLRLKVTAHGHVDSVRILEAKPRGIFEESAVATVKEWEFDPATYQGSPVETWVKQTLRFELN